MAWSAYTYNSLNGYCGNCSIILSSKIHIMIENKKVITWSLIILFLILSIVYSLTYQKKQSLFKNSNEIRNDVPVQLVDQNQWLWLETNVVSTESIIAKEMKDSVSLWDSSNTQKTSIGNINNPVSLSSTDIKILPGTTEYFGTLDIVSILGQKPKFTLHDSKWNYFAYYEDRLDFVNTIKTLWGSVYEMVTESEILKNQLFGDKVSYINLSMFKDVRVLMVVEIDGETWLLQIPADKYHYSKDYLKSLFIH